MREQVHLFGSHTGLVGVVTSPETPRPGAPALLYANVGLNHRVGPSRGWVELARRLADKGFLSLRFDLAGFGDSDQRREAIDDTERAVMDTREAMDFLAERHGQDRFVIVANCSGVDSQHVTALRDERVVGMVAIDGYVYRNRGYALHKALRPFDTDRWRRYFLRRRLARAGGGRRGTGSANDVWTRDWLTQEQFATVLATLTARGTRILFVYTSGVDTHLNYAGQFHDMFGYRDRIEVAFFPRADHLFAETAERARMVETVTDWMTGIWSAEE